MTDDAEKQRLRRLAAERARRARAGKVQVSFATSPEIRDTLRQMAKDHGYVNQAGEPVLKDFLEGLAKGYQGINE
ncbi:hypothetical protein TW86_04110 [Halomonas sp. S2151]|uniref:hypothetical protein n=1 Tax=Halomonas sp. S2151 TaxID=579478 RepID=UPI0005FA89EE|nr:hypothetical protein [Halomonas sp. S2151]KJZ17443.1 hypothetical protein TW86_04110 [Halomonas sp. S2151]